MCFYVYRFAPVAPVLPFVIYLVTPSSFDTFQTR